MGYQKQCVLCQQNYEAGSNGAKFCSNLCRQQARKISHQQSRAKLLKSHTCRHCKQIFIRYRKRNGFCGRTCASKFYIEDGTYDSWKLRTNEKSGLTKNCLICSSSFYVEPAEIEKKKLCGSSKCRTSYMSQLFSGKGNPQYGKKEKSGVREKVKQTLKQRYGVTNGYELAKRRRTSKSHLELFKTLKSVLTASTIKKEQKVSKYWADILVKDKNIIIEYNGTYYHCDPRMYSGSYVNKLKGLTAQQIWDYDENRTKELQSLKYDVIVVWEKDFKENPDKIVEKLCEVIRNK